MKRAFNKYLTTCVDQLPQLDIFIEAIHACGRSRVDILETNSKRYEYFNHVIYLGEQMDKYKSVF